MTLRWAMTSGLLFACSSYEPSLLDEHTADPAPTAGTGGGSTTTPEQPGSGMQDAGPNPIGTRPGPDAGQTAADGATADAAPPDPLGGFDPLTCAQGECWWSHSDPDTCGGTGLPTLEDRPDSAYDGEGDVGEIYLGWSRIRLGSSQLDGTPSDDAWQSFGLDLDGVCTNSSSCPELEGEVGCQAATVQLPFDGARCRDNTFASLQTIATHVPEIGERFGISEEVFNCELWHGSYNLVFRISGYNGRLNDSQVRVDFYNSDGLERPPGWSCPFEDYRDTYPLWRASQPFRIDESALTGPIEEEGRLPDSTLSDPEAYVRGGYLVAHVPDGGALRLAGDGMPYRGFPLVTHKALWIGHLYKEQSGTWAMRDGLTAGRIRKEDLVQSFRQVGFCPGMGLDPFYTAMVEYVETNADVLLSGEVDPSAPCDAISFGIGFEAHQLTPGAGVELEPMIECCAPGSTLEQCMTVCGDGAVTGDEQCDTAIGSNQSGGCPSSCAPIDDCTPTQLVGEGCAAYCEPLPITARGPDDGCCPDDANANEDPDCDPICGNEVVEAPEETCDPASSCPDCESPNACLRAVASGSAATCDARCELEPITACQSGDGCCPATCNSSQDGDCPVSCGNGTFEPARGETCENGTATPCPASCDDDDPCTTDQRTGSAQNCNVVCTHTPVVQPRNGDGCCPDVPQANANNDDDCRPECPNGATESGELCDGNCPTSCRDAIACTDDVLVGSASSCNARCTFPAITAPRDDDDCCPDAAEANANTDNDCAPRCGNRAIEAGELCDDGNTVSNDGCSSSCQIEADQAACLARLPENNACAQCSCLECRSEAVSCYGSSDATANARCAALVACGREHGCSSRDCYCGTVSDFSCILLDAGNGPCRAEVRAAAGSSDPFVILDRSTNTNYAIGRANALSACASAECAGPCDL